MWNTQEKNKNKLIDLKITMSIITLIGNRINVPIKKEMPDWEKTKARFSYVLCVSNKILVQIYEGV